MRAALCRSEHHLGAPRDQDLESLLARSERKRGISTLAIDCPLLVVAGRDYLDTRCRPVAEYYGAELVQFPSLSHFRLVADQRVRDAVARWADSVGH